MEAKILKNKIALYYSGVGITVFGLWSIIKVILFCMWERTSFQKFIADKEIDIENLDYYIVMVTFYLLIDLVIRLYIGRCAISSSGLFDVNNIIDRDREKWIYQILVAFLLAGLILETAYMVFKVGGLLNPMVLGGIIVNISQLVIYTDMLVAAHNLRRYRMERNV